MSENDPDTNKYKDYRKWEKRPMEISSLSFEEALKELEALSQRLSQAVCLWKNLLKLMPAALNCANTAMTCLKRAEDRVRELDQKFGNQQDDDEPEETPVSRRSRRNDDDIPF